MVHEHPGVYSSYDASSVIGGKKTARILGAAAVSTTGTANEVVTLTSYAEGVSAFLYTGGFHVPPLTLTGSVTEDLVLIERVLGPTEVSGRDLHVDPHVVGQHQPQLRASRYARKSCTA